MRYMRPLKRFQETFLMIYRPETSPNKLNYNPRKTLTLDPYIKKSCGAFMLWGDILLAKVKG